jgi:hypothetical protein
MDADLECKVSVADDGADSVGDGRGPCDVPMGGAEDDAECPTCLEVEGEPVTAGTAEVASGEAVVRFEDVKSGDHCGAASVHTRLVNHTFAYLPDHQIFAVDVTCPTVPRKRNFACYTLKPPHTVCVGTLTLENGVLPDDPKLLRPMGVVKLGGHGGHGAAAMVDDWVFESHPCDKNLCRISSVRARGFLGCTTSLAPDVRADADAGVRAHFAIGTTSRGAAAFAFLCSNSKVYIAWRSDGEGIWTVECFKDFGGFHEPPILISDGYRGGKEVLCVAFNTVIWILDTVTSSAVAIVDVPDPKKPIQPPDVVFPTGKLAVVEIERMMRELYKGKTPACKLPVDAAVKVDRTRGVIAITQPEVHSWVEAIQLSPVGTMLAIAKTDTVYVFDLESCPPSILFSLQLADTVSLLFTGGSLVCVHESGDMNALEASLTTKYTLPQDDKGPAFRSNCPVQWNVCAEGGETRLFVGTEGVIRILKRESPKALPEAPSEDSK